SNMARMPDSVALKARLPTKIFFTFYSFLSFNCAARRGRSGQPSSGGTFKRHLKYSIDSESESGAGVYDSFVGQIHCVAWDTMDKTASRPQAIVRSMVLRSASTIIRTS